MPGEMTSTAASTSAQGDIAFGGRQLAVCGDPTTDSGGHSQRSRPERAVDVAGGSGTVDEKPKSDFFTNSLQGRIVGL